MAVHTRMRRGKRRLIIDIYYRKSDGSQGRYRRDAQVQTLVAARAEERRRLAALAATGSPEAELVNGEFRSAAPAAKASSGQAVTFGQVARAYLEQYAPSRLKPSTRYGYSVVLQRKLIPRFGQLPVAKVDASKALKLDAELQQQGLKPSTRSNVQTVLRSVLCRFAVTGGYLNEAPVLPRLAKAGRTVLDVISTEELDKILDVAIPRHRLAFVLGAFAGLRAGEIRGLRWVDIDMDLNRLVVRQNICLGVVDVPKSGHERIIPLNARILAELEQMPKAERVGLVVRSARGRVLAQNTVYEAFQRARQRAGVRHFRFHDLRHYFVTALFRAGVSAPTVQKLAGHAKLTTTQLYAHVTPTDLANAIARL